MRGEIKEFGTKDVNGLSFFFRAGDGIRDSPVTGVQTCALPICDDDDNDAEHGFYCVYHGAIMAQ